LETIVQKNLFALPVGADGQWLRYHHLFSEYLQHRFRRECPEEVKPILQRLAQYQEGNGEWQKAYQIYKQLGDTTVLSEMIERAGIPMYQHAILTLESWLKELPPSLANSRPGLLSLRGAIASMKGNASEGVRLLDHAIGELTQRGDVADLSLAFTRRGNAHRLLGNYDEAMQDAASTLKLAQGRDELQWICADALRLQGLSLYRQGQSRKAINLLETALDIYVRVKDVGTIPSLQMETGMIYAAMGNYQDAGTSYEKALESWRRNGNLMSQANLLNNLGFLYYQMDR
jgi:ATP/maltotriose-dependent transcriptional regulator MalT